MKYKSCLLMSAIAIASFGAQAKEIGSSRLSGN